MVQKTNGIEFRYGQLHLLPERKDRSAPIGFGRKFGNKTFPVPALAPGMARQTKGTPSAYNHGVTQFDEPLTTKISQTGRNVPIHGGMTDEQIGRCVTCPSGSGVLGDSGSHSWRQEVGTKHGSHAPIGALPPRLITK
jgi:hypothetical protein